MRPLKEFFTPKRIISKLGALRFSLGTFKDVERTPHYEMAQSIEAYETRPNINSAINQFSRFVLGTSISIKSSDRRTSDFLNNWLSKRKSLGIEMHKFLISLLTTGNGYFEKSFAQTKNAGYIIDNLFSLPDSSRIYINLTPKEDLSDYYLYEVDPLIKTMKFGDELLIAENRNINYIRSNGRIFKKNIFCIPLHKSKIAHLPINWSRDNIYGRSYLASVIDDVNVIEEITKNWAMISRYRALNTKLISIGDENNPSTIEDIENLEEQLNNKTEEEHLIINKPIKTESLANIGEYDDMQGPIDFLRRDISSGLVPNFMTPWANPNSAATSERASIPFELEIFNLRNILINFLNKTIIDDLRKAYPWLNDDATFDFEGGEMISAEEKIDSSSRLYNDGVITFNEYRKRIGLGAVDGGDRFINDVPSSSHLAESKDGLKSTSPKMHNSSSFIFKESVSDAENKNFINKEIKKGTLKKKAKVLKSNKLGGKNLRLIEDSDSFHITVGPKHLKIFELDEKPAAITFYEVTKDKLLKMQDEFLKEETPEDEIVNDFFDVILNKHINVIDDLFKDIDRKGKRKTSEAFLSTTIFKKLNDRFKDFNKGLSSIVGKFSKKIFGKIVEPEDLSNDVQVEDDSLKDDLKKRADLLLKTKTLDQIKTFNQKAIQDIRRIMADGIAAGKSTSQIKQDIKDKYMNWKTKKNPQESDISRIVKTELNHNIHLMKLYKWKQMGFTKFLWITREDEKVREEHRRRNQRVFDISKALDGNDIFPGGSLNINKPNINCRCAAVLWE